MHPHASSTAVDRAAPRHEGSALLLAILGIVLVMALTAGLTMLLIADTKSVAESSRRMSAFFLAESGFEAAKRELAESTDSGGDGIGNVSAMKPEGSYTVTSTDLGNDRYELTSAGTSGGTTVNLKMVTAKSLTTLFPPSSLAVLGYSSSVNVELSSSVSFDGGDGPAVVLTDQAKFNEFGSALIDAVTQGLLPIGNLVGSVTSLVSSLNLPLLYDPDPDGSSDICSQLYTDFVNRMRGNVLPALSPSTLPGGSTINYGTSATPATVYMSSMLFLAGGKTLTGYGTLIVTNELRVDPSATLNWTGDVIVLGQSDQDGELDVRGNATVNGNVIVVGGTQRTVKLNLYSGSNLTVNGALTLMSDFRSGGKVDVSANSPLHVDGLFQSLGIENKLDFTSSSELILNGQMGIGPAIDPSISSKLDLRLNGYTALYKDSPKIQQGAGALTRLDSLLGQAVFATGLVHPTMTTEAWWPFYP